jgi:hypothetical protein
VANYQGSDIVFCKGELLWVESTFFAESLGSIAVRGKAYEYR